MLNVREEQRKALNRIELAKHLSIDRASVNSITKQLGLEPIYGVFPWHRVLKCVHRTDPVTLHTYYKAQLASHGITPPKISDLEAELDRPLLTMKDVAEKLGKRGDTLSKALREGRITLPFHTLLLAPRIRRFRPFEVELWLETGISFGIPYAAAEKVSDPKSRQADVQKIITASAVIGGRTTSISKTKREGETKTEARKAVFGAFAPVKRNNEK